MIAQSIQHRFLQIVHSENLIGSIEQEEVFSSVMKRAFAEEEALMNEVLEQRTDRVKMALDQSKRKVFCSVHLSA